MTRRVIIDVSPHNGSVNFGALRSAHPDLVGVIIKATEGRTYVSPTFKQQLADARTAGLLVGAYAFVRPQNAGTADDTTFEQVAGLQALPLGMWLDCEVTDGLDPVTVNARFHEDADEFKRRYPGHCGIYTGRWFWDPQTRGSGWASEFPLWVSGYVTAFSPALIPYPWTNCLLWQFSDNWNGTGIDASVFLGDDAAWSKWVGTPPSPPPNVNRFVSYPTLRMGARDSGASGTFPDQPHPVATLQNALNIACGFEGGNLNRIRSDGAFGPGTNYLLGYYQKTHGLGVDFVAGPRTWASLDA